MKTTRSKLRARIDRPDPEMQRKFDHQDSDIIRISSTHEVASFVRHDGTNFHASHKVDNPGAREDQPTGRIIAQDQQAHKVSGPLPKYRDRKTEQIESLQKELSMLRKVQSDASGDNSGAVMSFLAKLLLLFMGQALILGTFLHLGEDEALRTPESGTFLKGLAVLTALVAAKVLSDLWNTHKRKTTFTKISNDIEDIEKQLDQIGISEAKVKDSTFNKRQHPVGRKKQESHMKQNYVADTPSDENQPKNRTSQSIDSVPNPNVSRANDLDMNESMKEVQRLKRAQRYELAVPLALELLGSYPDQPLVYKSLAKVLALSGDVSQAKDMMAMAVNLFEVDLTTAFIDVQFSGKVTPVFQHLFLEYVNAAYYVAEFQEHSTSSLPESSRNALLGQGLPKIVSANAMKNQIRAGILEVNPLWERNMNDFKNTLWDMINRIDIVRPG